MTASGHEHAVISSMIKVYRDGGMPAKRWLSLFDTNQVDRIIQSIPEGTNPVNIRIILRSEYIWQL
jgi:hypothetical protein